MTVTPTNTADQVVASTLEWYNKNGFGNAIKTSNALLAKMMESGKGLRKLPGGRKIVEAVIIKEDANSAWYAGAEALDTIESDVLREASFDWKQLAGAAVISGLDYRNCTGVYEKQNIMTVLKEAADTTAREGVGKGMWATSQVAKQILTIPSIVSDSGVIGGIDPSTYPLWKSEVSTSAIVYTAVTSSELLDEMELMYNTVSANCGDSPDMVVTNTTLYTKYGRACQELKRFNPTQRYRADIGYNGYDFNNAFFCLDGKAPVNEIYFINTSDLKLNVHNKAMFTFTPLVMSQTSDSYFSRILFQGELSVRRRNSHGKVSFALAAS